MRYSSGHRERTRERIVEAASKLFRECGYDGVGIDAIMSEAGLTAGGFYAHFPSKEALFAEAMTSMLEPGRSTGSTVSNDATSDPLDRLIRGYLSRQHRDSVSHGCPLPVLTPDVARKSANTRQRYEEQLLRFIEQVEKCLSSDPIGGSREEALALIAECVGGLMLSRAVDDQKLSDLILRSCRRGAMKICGRQASTK